LRDAEIGRVTWDRVDLAGGHIKVDAAVAETRIPQAAASFLFPTICGHGWLRMRRGRGDSRRRKCHVSPLRQSPSCRGRCAQGGRGSRAKPQGMAAQRASAFVCVLPHGARDERSTGCRRMQAQRAGDEDALLRTRDKIGRGGVVGGDAKKSGKQYPRIPRCCRNVTIVLMNRLLRESV
jgi:hypothetical protein